MISNLGVAFMKSTELKRLTQAIQSLPADAIQPIKLALSSREGELGSSIILQEKTDKVSACPHCGSIAIAKWGKSSDSRQRFKCKESKCGKTFNALTGSIMARLRLPEKRITYAKCLMDGLSVREAAEEIGVHKNTAFRWRHKFMSKLLEPETVNLSGIIEVDETFFLQSFKGMKRGQMPRKARKRGGVAKKRGLSKEQIPVLVARDRSSKATVVEVMGNRTNAEVLKILEKYSLAPDAELYSDGAFIYTQAGKTLGVRVRKTPKPTPGKPMGSLHIQNVNFYHSHLKNWIARFRGVSTKHLPKYEGVLNFV